MDQKKGEPKWEFDSLSITPEVPSKNIIISSRLLSNLVQEIPCSNPECNGTKRLQNLKLEYTGVTCSRVTYDCAICGHSIFSKDDVGIVPDEAKSSFFNKKINSIQNKSNQESTGGPARTAWFQTNIQLALATVLNGTGGSELKTFASLLNLPNAASIENQFHRIEKDLIIPNALELQEESLNEALVEEGKLEMQKLGYSDEVIKQWVMEDSWDGRNTICQIGLHASYDMEWQKRGSGNSYSSTSGHGFLVGTNTNKILAVSIKSTRCRKCEYAQKKGSLSKNMSVSSIMKVQVVEWSLRQL